jgi:hypothetical protein
MNMLPYDIRLMIYLLVFANSVANITGGEWKDDSYDDDEDHARPWRTR